jgi:Rad3-related DNA helicase
MSLILFEILHSKSLDSEFDFFVWTPPDSNHIVEGELHLACRRAAYPLSKFVAPREVSNIIFASGTFTSKDAEDELDIAAPVKVAPNTELLFDRDIKCFCLGTKSDGSDLNCDSKNFDIIEVSGLITEFATPIPGITLVFCSSYVVIDGLFEQISRNSKIPVVKEPKDSTRLEELINQVDGAKVIFLAVHRGKLAEGFNFREGSLRAVICVGVPYASLDDPRVFLKVLSNKYEKDAMTAVNQSIGRIHRGRPFDFGVVILLDRRFTFLSKQLPSWISPNFPKSTKELSRNIEEYFRRKTIPNVNA